MLQENCNCINKFQKDNANNVVFLMQTILETTGKGAPFYCPIPDTLYNEIYTQGTLYTKLYILNPWYHYSTAGK